MQIIHSLLTKLFEKRGIQGFDELDEDEKTTYEQWQSVLSKDELTAKDIREFCKTQVDNIEAKWGDYNVDQSRKAELIPYHTVYKKIFTAIDSPKQMREALEKSLIQLIET